jgi:hypothetical protein
MNHSNLGQHCTLDDCHQLDFLPFPCKKCTGTFCLDHHKYAAHACEGHAAGLASAAEEAQRRVSDVIAAKKRKKQARKLGPQKCSHGKCRKVISPLYCVRQLFISPLPYYHISPYVSCLSLSSPAHAIPVFREPSGR